jgi:Flp pilus assembly secretin CpaC
LLALALFLAAAAVADIVDQPSDGIEADVITLARGTSELLQPPADVTRVAIADPSVADVVVVALPAACRTFTPPG